MNEQFRPPMPATTQAAEGLPRRAWTLAEVEQLAELGVFGGIDRERERFELIGGEIVPMSPKGAFHETVKTELTRFWVKRVPDDVAVTTETTFRLGDRDFLEPDFVFWPRALGIRGLKPDVVQFLIEIADSSLAYDIGRKAAIYAGLALPEFWVIDARRLVTHVHRQPAGGAFQSIERVPHTDLATPLLLPSLAVRLADLGLVPDIE